MTLVSAKRERLKRNMSAKKSLAIGIVSLKIDEIIAR
jgi:hypothetical protein